MKRCLNTPSSDTSAEREMEKIDIGSIHKICSGQVIISVASVVKELVENSLDAGAENVEIILEDFGSTSIQIIDDGSGIEENDLQYLVLKSHTSKISTFEDISQIDTYGFRGEALSSIANLSSHFEVVSRHKTAKVATKVRYNSYGGITQKQLIAGPIGTSIFIRNLFETIPVRRKELMKNAKRDFNKVLNIIHGFSLVVEKNVRIMCSTLKNNKKSMAFQSKKCVACLGDRVSHLIGVEQFKNLLKFEYHDDKTSSSDENNYLQIEGYISSCGEPSSMSSRCGNNGPTIVSKSFISINNRPCDWRKMNKSVNDTFKQHVSESLSGSNNASKSTAPFFVINIKTMKSYVDCNITPDKRTILTMNEDKIICKVKSSIFDVLSEASKTIMSLANRNNSSSIDVRVMQDVELLEVPSPIRDDPSFTTLLSATKLNSSNNDDDECNGDTSSSTSNHIISNKCGKSHKHERGGLRLLNSYTNTSHSNDDVSNSSTCNRTLVSYGFERLIRGANIDINLRNVEEKEIVCDEVASPKKADHNKLMAAQIPLESSPSNSRKRRLSDCEMESNFKKLTDTDEPSYTRIHSSRETCEEINLFDKSQDVSHEVMKSDNDFPSSKKDEKEMRRYTFTVFFDLNVCERNNKERMKSVIASSSSSSSYKTIIHPEYNKQAEVELKTHFKKDDFKKLKICGQFNLGFILATLHGREIFIIDQHASDEKNTYERLTKATIHQQLMKTHVMVVGKNITKSLGHLQRHVIRDHLHVFNENGFDFKFDDNKEDGGNEIYLTKVPYYRNWSFGASDVTDLVNKILIDEESKNNDDIYDNNKSMLINDSILRPSKVEAMLASRACRSSVMIGQSLTHKQMRNIVDNLSGLDQPWNCPHGRPTMRHVITYSLV